MRIRAIYKLLLSLVILSLNLVFMQGQSIDRPNVLLIMIDDLNDCIEPLGGHTQSLTPNMSKLASSGVTFKNAYTNAPMCGPSRASMITGIYPHHSRNFYQDPWYKNEVLLNSRTIMEQFLEAGYNVRGTGKILHHSLKENWTHFENPADYSPTPFDGTNKLPHPDVPASFSDIGWVDGSLGPFINLEGRKTTEGKPLRWVTGNPKIGIKTMRYIDDTDRDPTPDEINATWAAQELIRLSSEDAKEPFFLAVGFLRPHTPLVAPQKYFDMFPLDKIELSVMKAKDNIDTYLNVAYENGDVHALRFGKEMFEAIEKAYGSTELGLKKWTQAYLACVAAVDENVGQVLDALESSKLSENTIVILVSDHGFHMGEKDYLYKNSLWEESTRVPLIMKVPKITRAGSEVRVPVSLIDIYPTLMELCSLSPNNLKNEGGHQLDGHSLTALIANPKSKKWKGPKTALTVVYAGKTSNADPRKQHYAIKGKRYRYILYNTGHEELYDHKKDPHEWVNLVGNDRRNEKVLMKMRTQLQEMIAPIELDGFAKKN